MDGIWISQLPVLLGMLGQGIKEPAELFWSIQLLCTSSIYQKNRVGGQGQGGVVNRGGKWQ